MGCTPSKAAGVYTRDPVCPDLDTCSTFVPSLKSCVSTPERPGPCEETSNVRQTFLDGKFIVSEDKTHVQFEKFRCAFFLFILFPSVPRRGVPGRAVSPSSPLESWSSAPGAGHRSTKNRSPAGDLHRGTVGCWTAWDARTPRTSEMDFEIRLWI